MKANYVRQSTYEQNYDLQIDALQTAGCNLIYEDRCTDPLVLQCLCEQLRVVLQL